MTTLPVSVVVPHKTSRLVFFAQACFPNIIRNAPAEIIVIPDERGPAAKRNSGAKIASSEFLFFCDDDVVLKGGALEYLVNALRGNPNAAWAYSDYDHVVQPGVPFPVKAGRWTAGPWDAGRIRQEPFVSTMSLIRRSHFPGIDEALPRYDMWDLWLTMVERGGHAVYIPEVLFESHHIDVGVTLSVPPEAPLRRIKEKHNLEIQV